MLLENAFIFPIPPRTDGQWNPRLRREDVYFTASDGVRLNGWYVPHPQPIAHVLYCHGNGEHLGYLDWLLADFHQLGLAVFAIDYRGYGRSAGRPSEPGLLADGAAALDWLAQRTELPTSKLVVMGRSLGGAVVIPLAAAQPVRAVVLDATFSSMTDVAAFHFPWLPLRWLLRTRFDSLAKIRLYEGPLLQSHGTRDQIVPLQLGQQLFDACPSHNKRFLSIEGGNHNDPPPPEWYDAVAEFLTGLP